MSKSKHTKYNNDNNDIPVAASADTQKSNSQTNSKWTVNKVSTAVYGNNTKKKVQILNDGLIRKCSICDKKNVLGIIPKPDNNWKITDEICLECLTNYEVE